MGEKPIVEIRGATKTFNDGQVVTFRNLNLNVYQNKIICIVGPSGCGKTTLLRCINGLVQLNQGEILFQGKRVNKPNPNMAMVFQQFGLFPWKTVKDNIAYPLRLRKMNRAEIESRVMKNIETVGLSSFANSYPYQLSGGMQQRVGLARALATEPDLMLMDEPFAAVDAQTREVLQAELLKLIEQKERTMVFITHSIDEAIILGDQIAVMSIRPSNIVELINVEFEKPRDMNIIKGLPRFNELRTHIWNLLMSQKNVKGGQEIECIN
jgi:NitT/TauT family transport system ATP-binding protein